MKKILLIEPNPYHSEVLPGIVKYLEYLQYTVDVFVQESLLNDNAFCWYPHHVNLYGYQFSNLGNLLSAENIAEYDFVFFSSLEFTANGGMYNIVQHLGFMPKTKYGILGIYHTTSFIDRFKDYELMAEGRIFCFSDFQKQNYDVTVLNPHYFAPPQFCSTSSKTDDYLACVGGAYSERMLADALWKTRGKIKAGQLKIYLYGTRHSQTNIKRLKLFLKFFIPSRHRAPYSYKFIVPAGHLSFAELFTSIVRSKYILVLIDPANKDHAHYLTDSTSGVKQLALGFNKIPIIHRMVAGKYGFDESNSILFEDNEGLAEVLMNIANKSPYNEMDKIIQLRKLSERIESLSLANLRRAIERNAT
jgi:hypothetical protein